MNRLRTRLIAVFVVATLVPLGLTLWTTLTLLEQSLSLRPLAELDSVSKSLEDTGRELYRQARDSLRRDAAEGRVQGRRLMAEEAESLLQRDALQSGEAFELAGDRGNRLDFYQRRGQDVWLYSRPMGVPMQDLTRQYARARQAIETSSSWNFRRGFRGTLLLVAAVLWLAALAAMVFIAARITRPIRELTQGLSRVASGDLSTRVDPHSSRDEIGAALIAFNHMAEALEHARDRLVHVTRLASWQALARKMAHEVKNSLTPIRLTMEEIACRRGESDGAFLEQAAQIVVEEVQTLERRVRAFSEFAAEPPVVPAEIDINALLEERVSLLKSVHPDVAYRVALAPERPRAVADPDLIKGVLTNLLENAAQAAQSGGIVLARTAVCGEKLNVEIHDSGPGLSPQARSTLFEPTISFKKGGMGLGLSIARRSALLCGGDLEALEGELGGAGFRLVLAAENGEVH
jgi:two-component system nitrogen regulation sensor histidine kinase NtrY